MLGCGATRAPSSKVHIAGSDDDDDTDGCGSAIGCGKHHGTSAANADERLFCMGALEARSESMCAQIAASNGMKLECRPMLWPVLVGLEPWADDKLIVSDDDDACEAEYALLASQVDTVDASLIRTIDADIPRTDMSGERRVSLRALLLAHCVLEPAWGYFQGMNEVGCVLLEACEGGGGMGGLGRKFWLFRGVLAHSSENWARSDLGGVWRQARAVQHLLDLVDKPLAAKLRAVEGASGGPVHEQPLTFLFGPIFLRLKREMADLEQCMRLWEVCWASGRYFHVLVIAAFVCMQRKAVLRLHSHRGIAELCRLFGLLHGSQRAAPLLEAARKLQHRSDVTQALEQVRTAEIVLRPHQRHAEPRGSKSTGGGGDVPPTAAATSSESSGRGPLSA